MQSYLFCGNCKDFGLGDLEDKLYGNDLDRDLLELPLDELDEVDDDDDEDELELELLELEELELELRLECELLLDLRDLLL